MHLKSDRLLAGLIICFSFLLASCGGGGGEGPVTPVVCTYTYSEWGACQSDNTQTRTVISALPNECAGNPIISQTCPETRGTFVASGGNGIMLTSPDGINWDARSSGVVGDFSRVVQGNSTFVIWQNNRSFSTTIFSSTDLFNWTVRSSNSFPAIGSMIYANDLFVATSSFGFILTSPDGLNWTHSATLSGKFGSEILQGIAYGNGTFVTVGVFGGIYHSQDCVNWTPAASIDSTLDTVAYGNGIFVVVGPNKIFTSSDGANWTAKTSAPYPDFDIFSLAAGNNMFVALGDTLVAEPPAMLMIFNSPDGVNWTNGPSMVNPSPSTLSFEHGIFFLTGSGGTILTSTDGINWTGRTSRTTGYIGEVTFLNIPL